MLYRDPHPIPLDSLRPLAFVDAMPLPGITPHFYPANIHFSTMIPLRGNPIPSSLLVSPLTRSGDMAMGYNSLGRQSQ